MRYMVFAGESYYPNPSIEDFVFGFDDSGLAEDLCARPLVLKRVRGIIDWVMLVDVQLLLVREVRVSKMDGETGHEWSQWQSFDPRDPIVQKRLYRDSMEQFRQTGLIPDWAVADGWVDMETI